MISPLFRFGVGVFDFVGRGLRAAGLPLVPLDPERLMERAQRRTGLSDFGEWEYPEGLSVACGSLESEGDLSLSGRIALQEQLTLALETRLLRVQMRKDRPDVFGRPLNPPIFVLGLPRSGTTYLHRLLVDLPGSRGLRTWEIRRPFPPRIGVDRRRDEARAAIRVLRLLAPELDRKHVLEADAAEEEVGLFDSALWTPTFWRLAAVRSYLSWYLAQDPVPGYRVFREMLQVFQDREPDARLVLKLPNHLGFVGALLEVIPEALVVQTHRDPVPVIASYNSLMNSVHAVSAHRVDKVRNGHDGLEMWATLHERCVAQRAGLEPGRVLDVQYGDLLDDPVARVAEIHAHFGLEWDGGREARVRAMVADRKQNAHGKHVYALEDCQLDRAKVEARFARGAQGSYVPAEESP